MCVEHARLPAPGRRLTDRCPPLSRPPPLQNEYKGCSKKKDPNCGDCASKLQTCDVSLKQAQNKLAQQDQLLKVRVRGRA